jgi:triphosphoribosyl-dephospho-CoA synthase
VAGILEATAPKPGNVHPAASFPDLNYDQLVAAAIAVAPALDRAKDQPLGLSIRTAVAAGRAATGTNANLGIVLLIAPLAAVADDGAVTAGGVDRVLSGLDPADAAEIYRAIALARPGGLGTVDRFDVAGPPPADVRAAMRLAADRDQIARLWAETYEPLFSGPVSDLAAALDSGMSPLQAIVRCHVQQLARSPDSLIARRHGAAVAADVSAGAARLLETPAAAWPAALEAFDRSLREPRRLNPGTTADLVAAALYILLRDGRLRRFFDTDGLPFPAAKDPS